MSTYNSQEEKVILKDNDQITSIFLDSNYNLKVLIIDNISNLEKIHICINEGLYVSISNCENLKTINTYYSHFNNNNVYGSYFYLGENLKSLRRIDLSNFKTLKVADEVFDKLDSLNLSDIKSLICDFKNFPKLYELYFEHVESSDLIVDSERVSTLSLSHCSFENIEIIGNGNINDFDITIINTEYKSLKAENPIKTTDIAIYYNDNNKMIPYIPLSNEIDEVLKFYVDIDNLYDYEYKYFIERNLSKVKIYTDNYEEITLDDMKFNVPQKKRAR